MADDIEIPSGPWQVIGVDLAKGSDETVWRCGSCGAQTKTEPTGLCECHSKGPET